MNEGDPRLITRVALRNYRSIAACDVALQPLTFLVGPNGSGKSNFLDALRFVADALRTSLDHALRDRGGINEVRRRSTHRPRNFGLRLDLQLPLEARGHYAFEIAGKSGGGYAVRHEECAVRLPQAAGGSVASYVVDGGSVRTTAGVAPPASLDRLYLVNAAGLPEFRPVYDALSQMGFYNLNPDRIRDLQSPDPGEMLARDGGNITSVLSRMRGSRAARRERIVEYLGRIVPGVRDVQVKSVGPKEQLEFRQLVPGSADPWRFPAGSMSDGTLRALGILVALLQGPADGAFPVPLIGIEEPEVALHPAAAGVLLDALREASSRSQVVVTSHSPDLLDNGEIDTDSFLAVVAEAGETQIGPLDEAGRSVLRDRLYTAGELLRLDQLRPDLAATADAAGKVRLFDTGAG